MEPRRGLMNYGKPLEEVHLEPLSYVLDTREEIVPEVWRLGMGYALLSYPLALFGQWYVLAFRIHPEALHCRDWADRTQYLMMLPR